MGIVRGRTHARRAVTAGGTLERNLAEIEYLDSGTRSTVETVWLGKLFKIWD